MFCFEIFEDWIYYKIKQISFAIISENITPVISNNNSWYATKNNLSQKAPLVDRIIYKSIQNSLCRTDIIFRKRLLLNLYSVFEGKDCIFCQLCKLLNEQGKTKDAQELKKIKTDITKIYNYTYYRNKIYAHRTIDGLKNASIGFLDGSEELRDDIDIYNNIKIDDESIKKLFNYLKNILQLLPKLRPLFQKIYISRLNIDNFNTIRSLVLKELCFKYPVKRNKFFCEFKKNCEIIKKLLYENVIN